MAVRDHTARACVPAPPGDTPASAPESTLLVACHQAYSLHLSTLDDIAMAVFALSRLLEYNAGTRTGTRRVPEGLVTWPLPALFVEGLGTAKQCLEQYADMLGRKPAASV